MTQQKSLIWYHLLIVLIVSIWGTTYVSTSILLHGGIDRQGEGLAPLQIYTLRSIIAYAGLLIACHRQLLAKSVRDELLFIVLGLTGGTVYYLCENTAVIYTDVSNVSLIVASIPVATMLLSAAIYKTRLRLTMILGSLIALSGIACVIFADGAKLSGGIDSFWGDLLAFGAVISWSIYSLILPKLFDKYSTLFITRKVFFYGMLSAVTALCLNDLPLFPIETLSKPIVLGNLLYLGLIASLFCFWAFNIGMARIGIVTTNNYGYLTPVVTFISAIIVLGDDFTAIGAIGVVITLAGLYLAQYSKSPTP